MWQRGEDGSQNCTRSICSARALAGTFGGFSLCAETPGVVLPRREMFWQPHSAEPMRESSGAQLRVWEMAGGAMPVAESPTSELGIPSCVERQTYEAEFGDEGAFGGYGATAFSPDGNFLAKRGAN